MSISGDTAEARVASGKKSRERAGLVYVRELEADIVVHQPLVHQTLEAPFAKCIIKVFYIVAP